MQKEQFIHIKNGNKFYYSDREMLIRHREDGPAIVYANGSKSWYLNGERHREDGPACEGTDSYKAWYLNGKRHREDGPAIEYADGSKEWYLNDKLHREDGPASEWSDGFKAWYLNGKYHREDGPAIEYVDGSKEWYLNDKRLTEAEFNARINPVTELTLDEIAEKFGIQEVKSVTIKFQTPTPYTNEQNSRTN